MAKLILPFLETMITQVCNLSCSGCTNYSDLSHSGYVTWTQGRAWLESWLDILGIPDFGIMGGEPLINPEVQEWITGTREIMPDSQIRFTTNGLLWHKWPDLIDLLHDVGNVVLKITVHTQDNVVENIIDDIFHKFNWEPITEYGIDRWRTTRNLRFQINRPTHFLKTYRNHYEDMMPYHSQPIEAFDLCVQKTCPLLYRGRIYKCSTVGLLEETLNRFDQPNWSQWERYIDPGISVDSDRDLIVDFVSNFGKPHQRCGQCPSKTEHAIPHLITVIKK